MKIYVAAKMNGEDFHNDSVNYEQNETVNVKDSELYGFGTPQQAIRNKAVWPVKVFELDAVVSRNLGKYNMFQDAYVQKEHDSSKIFGENTETVIAMFEELDNIDSDKIPVLFGKSSQYFFSKNHDLQMKVEKKAKKISKKKNSFNYYEALMAAKRIAEMKILNIDETMRDKGSLDCLKTAASAYVMKDKINLKNYKKLVESWESVRD